MHCCRLLKSLVAGGGTASGTSVLVQGPEPILLSAVVEQALVQQSSNSPRRTVHLHGLALPDPATILSQICTALSHDGPRPSTFEDLGGLLGGWLRGNPGYRLLLVLGAFEKFAASFQNFLYTIFELTGSLPLDVVVWTCRTDVIDTLEKRVKSRFSQNVICLSHPKTFEAYLAFIRTALEGTTKAAIAPSKKYLQSVKKALANVRIVRNLEGLYSRNRDPLEGLKIFTDALAGAHMGSPSRELCLEYVLQACEGAGDALSASDHTPTIAMPALCVAEWCALIALKRVQSKSPDAPVNFEVLYEEYAHGFAASASSSEAPLLARKFSRTVLRSAVDMLVARGLVAVAGQTRQLESVAPRQDLQARLPLSQLAEWLGGDETCPAVLKKLASEAL